MRLDYIWAFHSKPLENRLDIREGISADLRKTLWSRMSECKNKMEVCDTVGRESSWQGKS